MHGFHGHQSACFMDTVCGIQLHKMIRECPRGRIQLGWNRLAERGGQTPRLTVPRLHKQEIGVRIRGRRAKLGPGGHRCDEMYQVFDNPSC